MMHVFHISSILPYLLLPGFIIWLGIFVSGSLGIFSCTSICLIWITLLMFLRNSSSYYYFHLLNYLFFINLDCFVGSLMSLGFYLFDSYVSSNSQQSTLFVIKTDYNHPLSVSPQTLKCVM